ncbi:fungal-specific transcription factor domain-containing protein [Aspergillus varians]
MRTLGERNRRASGSPDSATSVGSLNEVDTLTEDPNRNLESRAAGYIGKESEIAWMHRLETEASKLNQDGRQQRPFDESLTSMSYHVDYLRIADPYPVDPRLLPPKPWAANLVDIFFDSIAPCFPLLNRLLFASQFDYAFSGSAEPTQKWLAVLNLVFAISSKYYQLANPVAGKDVDDRIFLSRAMALNTSHNLAIEHPDLHQVQIDLLLAIYYLASGHVNRSWQINGRAARSAISLGLNLRVMSDQIDPTSKETRTRIWWSIFSLEHILASMTGRAPCVDYRSMPLYPPVPYDESSFQLPELEDLLDNIDLREERLQWTIYASNSELQLRTQWFRSLTPTQSLFFFHLVDLCIITHAAVTAIYSLTAVKDSGQSGIPHYQEKLQTWLSTLQPPFAFTDNGSQPAVERNSHGQVSLALAYYSSQIILSRPCLTSPDRKEGTNIRFPRSRFGNDTAKTCVHSALALISVLPDNPDTQWALRMTSWWCILHFIMQALTVLLIQLNIGPVPIMTRSGVEIRQADGYNDTTTEKETEQEAAAVLTAAKKALHWLHHLAKSNPSAHRAFQISDRFIRRIGHAKDLDLSGLPSGAELLGQKMSAFGSGDSHPWVDRLEGRQCSEQPGLGAGAGAGSRTSVRQTGFGVGGGDVDVVNWGPDCTFSEEEFEFKHPPFAWDPALFTVDM